MTEHEKLRELLRELEQGYGITISVGEGHTSARLSAQMHRRVSDAVCDLDAGVFLDRHAAGEVLAALEHARGDGHWPILDAAILRLQVAR